jgi:hypothetical protein
VSAIVENEENRGNILPAEPILYNILHYSHTFEKVPRQSPAIVFLLLQGLARRHRSEWSSLLQRLLVRVEAW